MPGPPHFPWPTWIDLMKCGALKPSATQIELCEGACKDQDMCLASCVLRWNEELQKCMALANCMSCEDMPPMIESELP